MIKKKQNKNILLIVVMKLILDFTSLWCIKDKPVYLVHIGLNIDVIKLKQNWKTLMWLKYNYMAVVNNCKKVQRHLGTDFCFCV